MGQPRHLLAFIAISALSASVAAHGASREFDVAGRSLEISSPCAARVTIDPASDGDVIRIAATASYPEEIAQLAVGPRGGATAIRRVDPARACWKPDGDAAASPTLVLAIRVPPATPITLEESGASAYAIGAVGGPLAAHVSGAVTLGASQVAALELDLFGHAEIRIGSLSGPAVVRSAGDADIAIADARTPSLRLDLSGAGTVAVTDGTIGHLVIQSSGAARAAFGGTVGDASLTLSGAGDVRIAALTGTLRRAVTGVATIEIGG